MSAPLAVVVGASGAFGSVIVDRLVGLGHTVVAVGRDPAPLGGLVERHGPAVRPCATDIADDAATGAVRAALADDEEVLAVVHGPGLAVAGGIATVPPRALADAVDVKVGGLLRVVRAVDHRLVSGSRVIAIAGHYGLEPSAYAAVAGIANAALVNAVRQLSLVVGGRGVTAHTIVPGPADTERLRRVAVDRAEVGGGSVATVLDELRDASSIGELTTPEQVAWAVTTLLDPHARAMTGSCLMLDAGRRRGLP